MRAPDTVGLRLLQDRIVRVRTMSDVRFQQLTKLPLVRCYQRAFRMVTGMHLHLVPTDPRSKRRTLGSCQNPFCRLMARIPRFRRVYCTACEGAVQHSNCDASAAPTVCCPAGLKVVTSPVVVGGRHVATWIGGRVFSRKPAQSDFKCAARQLAQAGIKDGLRQIEAAFFGTRVIPAGQLLAMRQLLSLFAQHVEQHLDESVDRMWIACRRGEPGFVTRAKEFVQEHVTEPIKLRQVAAVVHTDPRDFRRVFSEATGLPFTEYLSSLRVEKAKAMLLDPTLQVAQVAYATGFASISQFSKVFCKWVGKSPAKYRAVHSGR